jgi:hypothetical protein
LPSRSDKERIYNESLVLRLRCGEPAARPDEGGARLYLALHGSSLLSQYVRKRTGWLQSCEDWITVYYRCTDKWSDCVAFGALPTAAEIGPGTILSRGEANVEIRRQQEEGIHAD